MQGDSAFTPDDQNPLPATEDSTFESLLEAWKKLEDEDNEDEDATQPTGFWILTKDHLEIACVPLENDSWGNDSQWYSLARSAKSICKKLAVKTVKAP